MPWSVGGVVPEKAATTAWCCASCSIRTGSRGALEDGGNHGFKLPLLGFVVILCCCLVPIEPRHDFLDLAVGAGLVLLRELGRDRLHVHGAPHGEGVVF